MNEVKTHRFHRSWPLLHKGRSLAVMALAAVFLSGGSFAMGGEFGISIDELLPLDEKRLFALGMIESGNDDRGVGPAGEVSRYQIQPFVWKSYSESREYHAPDLARNVASQHWNYLAGYFRERSGREPTDFDMYILWNTRFGYYASKGFDRQLVNLTVRDRARRFVNLVNR